MREMSGAYPNPAQDAFSVQFNMDQNDGAVLLMYDAVGNRVQQVEVSGNRGVVKLQLNNLGAGIYFYHIKNGSAVSQTMKVVKL